MRILYLPPITLLWLIGGCEQSGSNSQAPADSTVLVGIWQDYNALASGWSNAYQFFPDGKFVFHTNQMDCESRNRTLSGNWQLESGYLNLVVVSEGVIVGGSVVEAVGSCATEKAIEDGVLTEMPITPSRTTTKILSRVLIDKGTNRFGQAYEMEMIEIDGDKYWKFESDPSKY